MCGIFYGRKDAENEWGLAAHLKSFRKRRNIIFIWTDWQFPSSKYLFTETQGIYKNIFMNINIYSAKNNVN